jgi:hypothetical protein
MRVLVLGKLGQVALSDTTSAELMILSRVMIRSSTDHEASMFRLQGRVKVVDSGIRVES